MRSRRDILRSFLFTGGWVLGTSSGVLAAAAKRPLPTVDLSFLDRRVTLKRRTCWTDTRPRPWLLREAGGFSRITVHHQGAGVVSSGHENTSAAAVDAVYGGHCRIGYADIGYHFVVDYDGRIWEARSLAYEGAHVAGANEKNLGILMLGNFDRQTPSTKSLDAIRELVDALQAHYAIDGKALFGHRDLGASDCPGKNLHGKILKMRRTVQPVATDAAAVPTKGEAT